MLKGLTVGPTTRARRAGLLARLALFCALALLAGCGARGGSAKDPFAYKAPAVARPAGGGSELDARIAFLEERLKQRPDAFLEEAELAGLYLQKGKLRQQTQQLEKAREWAQSSLAIYPNSAAQVVLADLLQMEHKFDESLGMLGQILAEEPASQEARVLAIRALLAQGKAEQAQQVLDAAIGQTSFALTFLEGQILEARGELDAAAGRYQAALGQERMVASPSESARLRGVWGRLELTRGNLDLAAQLLDAAKAIPVEVPLVELQRARLEVARQQPKKAAEILRQAFALYQDPVFLVELGNVQESQGQVGEARHSYQAAADLIKGHPYGHERDRALALLRLDAKANREEILRLMDTELTRRRDAATMDVWKQVAASLGPLPEPPPFSTSNPIVEAAAKPKARHAGGIIPTAQNTPSPPESGLESKP